jgi:hypothetical protein
VHAQSYRQPDAHLAPDSHEYALGHQYNGISHCNRERDTNINAHQHAAGHSHECDTHVHTAGYPDVYGDSDVHQYAAGHSHECGANLEAVMHF